MVRTTIIECIQKLFSFFFSVMAALSVANIVKTSLGPVGLDKMLVDDVGVSSFFCFFFVVHFVHIYNHWPVMIATHLTPVLLLNYCD